MTEPSPKLLDAREVADLFRVDTATVRRWIRDGKLPGFRTPGEGGGCGRFRIREADALALRGPWSKT